MGPPSLDEIVAARERLRGLAIRTPLMRWHDGPGEIWLKLETLQPVGAFKIRGAGNAMLQASADQLRKGVVTASAGNMAQGVAWCARMLGIPCHVVVPDHAPLTKIAAIERLGGQITKVSFDRWWRVLQERHYDGCDGLFIHPVADPAVIAGNATIGLEIAEDLPDVATILVPYGGGGLASGVAAAMASVAPAASVVAVEPETAAPLHASWSAGAPVPVDYRASFIDGSGGKAVLAEMWPLVRSLLKGAVTVTVAQTAESVRLLAERARVVAEGAGALALAAARSGRYAGGKVVAVVSGGNIDSSRLVRILQGEVPE